MTHEKRIVKLEKTVSNHETRITNLENKYEVIITGIKGIDSKLPKHPILNILSYIGAGVGICVLVLIIISVIVYG